MTPAPLRKGSPRAGAAPNFLISDLDLPRKGSAAQWASSAPLAAPHYLICGERGSGKPILPRFWFFLQLVAAYRGYPEPQSHPRRCLFPDLP